MLGVVGADEEGDASREGGVDEEGDDSTLLTISPGRCINCHHPSSLHHQESKAKKVDMPEILGLMFTKM